MGPQIVINAKEVTVIDSKTKDFDGFMRVADEAFNNEKQRNKELLSRINRTKLRLELLMQSAKDFNVMKEGVQQICDDTQTLSEIPY